MDFVFSGVMLISLLIAIKLASSPPQPKMNQHFFCHFQTVCAPSDYWDSISYCDSDADPTFMSFFALVHKQKFAVCAELFSFSTPDLVKVNLLLAKLPFTIWGPLVTSWWTSLLISGPSYWPTGPQPCLFSSQWIRTARAPIRLFFFFPRSHLVHVPTKCVFGFSKKWPMFEAQIEREIASSSICHTPPPPPLPRRLPSLLLRGNHRPLAAGIYPQAWKYAARVTPGQLAFHRHHKDGLSHALNCPFEGNE